MSEWIKTRLSPISGFPCDMFPHNSCIICSRLLIPLLRLAMAANISHSPRNHLTLYKIYQELLKGISFQITNFELPLTPLLVLLLRHKFRLQRLVVLATSDIIISNFRSALVHVHLIVVRTSLGTGNSEDLSLAD